MVAKEGILKFQNKNDVSRFVGANLQSFRDNDVTTPPEVLPRRKMKISFGKGKKYQLPR